MSTTKKAEQHEKAMARRQQMRALAKQISAMPIEKRVELASKFPVSSIEGKLYSPFNTCMLITQNPTATLVGGFHQWRKAGRMVKKGEHGMALWFPTNQSNGNSEALKTGEGSANGGTEELRRMRFLLGTVFDVSQTEEKVKVAA